MNTYEVTIQATVIKTLTVEAENEQEAQAIAHEDFTTQPDDNREESYDEEMLSIEQKPSN